MKARFVRKSIFISALFVFALLLSFHSSWLSIEGATSAQDPNATLPSPKKTPTPKTTTPPPKKRTPRNSRTSPAKSASDSATAAELIFWNSIKDSTNPDDFKEYLKKYPDGEFAGLAANRLKTLEAAKSSTSPSTTSPSTTNSSSSSLPRTRTNQTGIEFVLIPAGSFMMGSTNGGSDEKPVHQVTISQPFYIGRYEVTQAQWQSVMGNNPSNFKDCGGNCPVEQVSWDDAQKFVNKLNESNDGFRYRLPTEAEWEYACRAGTTGDYYGNVDDIGWYFNNSGQKTHAVGGKQPNAFGLYDMSGNVDEWCEDWYDGNYYASSPATDPQGPNSGPYRVLRGSSWDSFAAGLRSVHRFFSGTDFRFNEYGFRLAAVVRTS
jgi:formylglycine-generating enzyme required for sulfatase activity